MKITKIYLILLAALLTCTSAIASTGSDRLFFMLANKNYKVARQALKNPHNDGWFLAGSFNNIGYEVDEAHDLQDKGAFDGVVERFLAKMDGKRLGVLYYAGHGGAIDNQQYLFPTGVDLTSPRVKQQSYRLNDLINAIESQLNYLQRVVVIIDACRDNIGSDYRSPSLDRYTPMGEVKSASKVHVILSTSENGFALDKINDSSFSPFAYVLGKNLPQFTHFGELMDRVSKDLHSLLRSNDKSPQLPNYERNSGLQRLTYRVIEPINQPLSPNFFEAALSVSCIAFAGDHQCFDQAMPLSKGMVEIDLKLNGYQTDTLIQGRLNSASKVSSFHQDVVESFCLSDRHGHCKMVISSDILLSPGEAIFEAWLAGNKTTATTINLSVMPLRR